MIEDAERKAIQFAIVTECRHRELRRWISRELVSTSDNIVLCRTHCRIAAAAYIMACYRMASRPANGEACALTFRGLDRNGDLRVRLSRSWKRFITAVETAAAKLHIVGGIDDLSLRVPALTIARLFGSRGGV